MKIRISTLLVASSISLCCTPALAGFKDWMKSATDLLGKSPQASQALTQTDLIAGIREALAQGTRNAILSLGQTDGFLGNALVRIPLPPPMDALEPKLRKFGLSGPLDEFALSINRAAEQAVPEAADIFAGAIQAMTIEDARSIVQGDDDAATRFFERTTSAALTERITPLVAQATTTAGVTNAYKSVVRQAGPLAGMIGSSGADLDGYVTDKALQALFTTIAAEERQIRQNPAARTTDLLQRVFGAGKAP